MSNAKEKRTSADVGHHVDEPCRIIYDVGSRKPHISSPLPLAKIPLNYKPVVPSSIKLTMFGEEIVPTHITPDGIPKFSEEASLILYCKEHFAKHGRITGTTPVEVTVNATYVEAEELICDEEKIDTLAGIQEAITSLDTFYELCQKRSIYAKNSRKTLNTFIVFGRVLLDERGYIRRLDRIRDHIYNLNISPEDLPVVCTKAEFDKYATTYECTTPFRVPAPGEKCPICGREFTIADLYKALTVMNTGLFQEVVHDSCKHEYEYYLELKTLLFDIVDQAYPNLCKFEILDNPNLLDKAHLHLPWVLVHTQSGDIKLGRKYDKITIEWQPNFKAFDIAGLNHMTSCVKWTSDASCFTEIGAGLTCQTGVRGIAVSKVSEAVEALTKAHKLAFFSR